MPAWIGGGRACTITTPEIAQTLYRYAVHKGEAVRLDWEHGALAPPSEMSPAPPATRSFDERTCVEHDPQVQIWASSTYKHFRTQNGQS